MTVEKQFVIDNVSHTTQRSHRQCNVHPRCWQYEGTMIKKKIQTLLSSLYETDKEMLYLGNVLKLAAHNTRGQSRNWWVRELNWQIWCLWHKVTGLISENEKCFEFSPDDKCEPADTADNWLVIVPLARGRERYGVNKCWPEEKVSSKAVTLAVNVQSNFEFVSQQMRLLLKTKGKLLCVVSKLNE